MIRIAMIGVGAISGIYIKNINETFRDIQIIGMCDLIPERAENGRNQIREQIRRGVDTPEPKIYKDMYEAFDDPDVDVVLNITRPYEHYEVTKQALLHGKHVYSEKPLAVDMDEADELMSIAKEKGLHLGGAPDTFMGAGIQTCRRLIDDGFIGDVIGADCAMISHGTETWHPDPEFFYKRGGGPMLDMGPYYVTALVNLLGEAKEICGMTKRSFDRRIITSRPHAGEVIDVEVETYQTGAIRFSSGAVASITTTFDAYYTAPSRFEVFGTRGTLIVPDPNTFGGPILMYRPEDHEFGPSSDPGYRKIEYTPYKAYKEMPLMYDYRENSRGLGLADMCKAIETGRGWRANCDQQYHVLEIMTSFVKASREGKTLTLKSSFDRAPAMLNNPMHGVLDN